MTIRVTTRTHRPDPREHDAGSPVPNYPIGSVDSALRLLLMFGDQPEVRIADASDRLGVSRSTVHRLMKMLQFYGFVSQDPASKVYRAGPVWVNMGLQGVRNLDIRTVARPDLERLVAEVKETVQLVALQPSGADVCIDAVEGPLVVRAAGRVGVQLVPHATAGGRVLLAWLPQSRLHELYPKPRLTRPARCTIGTRAELERELASIRDTGYAFQRDELEPGVSAIAAPIRDSRGGINFAVDVVMPTLRLDDKNVQGIAADTVTCAQAISNGMPW
jgi:DNA-binding IclR family transcriptional regulator